MHLNLSAVQDFVSQIGTLTASFLTVEVGVEPLGAGLGDLVDLRVRHVLEEAAQVGARVQRLQRLLVQLQHLVHPPLVF